MEKLEWVYKDPNSLVDPDEYLLGRKIDKTAERLNEQEKESKIILPTPKNHVEYECIPPSIRDFNKIVQAEQVDLTAKLQEDPLIAIKKREEEARRNFLQNPIQIKKLQEALRQQTLQKKIAKSKKKHSKSSLDKKILEKLKLLKTNSSSVKKQYNPLKSDAINTILMHKFNALKHKLSEDDLKDILNGHVTSSSSESDDDKTKRRKRSRSSSRSSQSSNSSEDEKKKYKKKKNSQSLKRSDNKDRGNSYDRKREYDRKRLRHRDDNKRHRSPDRRESRYRRSRSRDDRESKKQIIQAREKAVVTDNDLDQKILAKLRLLRNEADKSSKNKDDEENVATTKSKIIGPKRPNESSDSDSDSSETNCHTKQVFGLVSSDGKKIQLKQSESIKNQTDLTSKQKPESTSKPDRKPKKKLTEKEKEKLRMEMMNDAKVRDKEREQKVKKYRENSKKEEEEELKNRNLERSDQLLKSNDQSVADRIRSKLNFIQRSSSHMETNFVKR